MTLAIIDYDVVPTGGTVILNLTAVSPMTLSRAVSGVGGLGAFTQLYTGDWIPLFIDAGEMLPSPLSPGVEYVYQVVDPAGTVQTPPIMPVGQITVTPDGLTTLLVRLLQAGVAGLTRPDGVSAAKVSNAMPINGFPPLPFIVVNLDLIQQENVPIGQNVVQPDGNNMWTQASYAKRLWRVSILARTDAERDFYRDSLLAVFQSLLGSVFSALGADMSHRYQAASGQTSDEYQGKSPGFYFADLMLEVLGTFNTTLQTSFTYIEAIDTSVELPGGVTDESQVGTPT